MSASELPEDIQEAIDACKEFQRSRSDAPSDTPAFLVEACGEKLVCMPPSYEADQRLKKLFSAMQQDRQQTMRYLDTYAAETIFWMQGQVGTGQKAALDQARKVAKSHFSKYDLLFAIVNQVQERLGDGEAPATSKKY
jgi:hypothetical protein